jgi:hypothetical protein
MRPGGGSWGSGQGFGCKAGLFFSRPMAAVGEAASV